MLSCTQCTAWPVELSQIPGLAVTPVVFHPCHRSRASWESRFLLKNSETGVFSHLAADSDHGLYSFPIPKFRHAGNESCCLTCRHERLPAIRGKRRSDGWRHDAIRENYLFPICHRWASVWDTARLGESYRLEKSWNWLLLLILINNGTKEGYLNPELNASQTANKGRPDNVIRWSWVAG